MPTNAGQRSQPLFIQRRSGLRNTASLLYDGITSTWIALFSLAVLCNLIPAAHATPGYACYDQPCAEARKDYVDRWQRQVCAHASSLKTLLRRKTRSAQVRAEIVARLNRCLARNPGRVGACAFHARRLRSIDRSLADLQRRIDRLVVRLQRSCAASLPNGVPGVPPTCEEQEAGKYCPINGEEQALQSLERRCNDLKAEKLIQDGLCNRCVIPPVQISALESQAEEIYSEFASNKPTCVPVATVTSTPTATAIPLITPSPTTSASPIPDVRT